MLTGDIRNQVDQIWNAFWSGGISNPLEVIEQITYLLFIRRLDDLQTNAEGKAVRLGEPIERRVFPEGKDAKKRPYDDYRWSRFKNREAKEMYEIVSEHVFPFLRTMGGEGSTYAKHMEGARFTMREMDLTEERLPSAAMSSPRLTSAPSFSSGSSSVRLSSMSTTFASSAGVGGKRPSRSASVSLPCENSWSSASACRTFNPRRACHSLS
jgi:hypothetical protein